MYAVIQPTKCKEILISNWNLSVFFLPKRFRLKNEKQQKKNGAKIKYQSTKLEMSEHRVYKEMERNIFVLVRTMCVEMYDGMRPAESFHSEV